MDAGLAKQALDDAFAAQVSKLFGVMCNNYTADSPSHAVEVFGRGFAIAQDCHARALKLVPEKD